MSVNKEFKYDVFISYQKGKQNTIDSSLEIADHFQKILEGTTNYKTFSCFNENENNFVISIDNGLENSKHFIIFIADLEITDWVDKEIKTFIERKKKDPNTLMIVVLCKGEEGLNRRDLLKVLKDKYADAKFEQTDIISTSETNFISKIKDRLNKAYGFKMDCLDYNEYLSDLKQAENYFSNLPREKFSKSIYYKKNIYDDSNYDEMISNFKSVYINKRIFKEVNGEVEIVLDFINYIKNNSSIILRGDAGCGKSTLLFKLYIDLIEKMNDSKIIPFFLDLATINNIESFRDYAISRVAVSPKYNIEEILKSLRENGYRVIYIFDSFDEAIVNKEGLISKIKLLSDDDVLRNIDANYLIAGRTGAIEYKNSMFLGYGQILVKNFDFDDAKIYIENLKNKGVIDERQVEIINKSVDVIAFDDEINPFLLSMIVGPYAYNKRYDALDNKVVNLIDNNVRSLCESGRSLSENYELRDKTEVLFNSNYLALIGISGKKKISIRSKKNFNKYWNEEDYDDYRKMIKDIMEKTYLLNTKEYFYQQLFNDYYGALYLFNIWEKAELDFIRKKIIKELLENTNNNELIGFFTLICDANSKGDFNNSPLNGFVEMMFSASKDKIIYNNIKVMISSMRKYSETKIVKDMKPIVMDSTYYYNEFIKWIYKKYFTYLCNKNKIDYDYFYGILVTSEKFDLAVDVIINMEYDNYKFNMLSILRDAYLNINYYKSSTNYFNYDNLFNNIEDLHVLKNQKVNFIKRVLKIVTNNKNKLKELSLRESLNFLFFAGEESIKYGCNNFSNDKSFELNYYPTIYNFMNFISDGKDNHKGKITLVSKNHNLLFDYKKSYFGIDFIDVCKLNIGDNSDYIFEDNIISAFFYNSNNNPQSISNNYKNIDKLLTIDVSEGIKRLGEYAFDNASNLINIILPESLQSIDSFSIYAANHLRKLYIPDNVNIIGESIVEDDYSLKEIHIPNGLKEMGEYVFEQCDSLSKISFEKVAPLEFKNGIFKGCKSITSIDDLHLPIDIDKFPKIFFGDCDNFVNVDLSKFDRLKKIGSYCFQSCNNLENIIFSKSIEEYGMAVFVDCKKIKSITFLSVPKKMSKCFLDDINYKIKIKIVDNEFVINNSKEFINVVSTKYNVEIIDDKFINGITFEYIKENEYSCDYKFNIDDADDLIFDSSNYNFDIVSMDKGALGNSKYYQQIRFDDKLIELAEWAFEDCFALFKVDLSTTKVEIIPMHTFTNCYTLNEVSLPDTTRVIKKFAFENCKNLTNIKFGKDSKFSQGLIVIPPYVKTIEKDAFKGCDKLCDKNLNIKINYYSSTDIKTEAFPKGTNFELLEDDISITDEYM